MRGVVVLSVIVFVGCSSERLVYRSEGPGLTSYAAFNEELADEEATLILAGGREIWAADIQVVGDSIVWFDAEGLNRPHGENGRQSIQLDSVQTVRERESAWGWGLLAGVSAGFAAGAIIWGDSWGGLASLGGAMVVVPAGAAIGAMAGAYIGSHIDYRFQWESGVQPISPDW